MPNEQVPSKICMMGAASSWNAKTAKAHETRERGPGGFFAGFVSFRGFRVRQLKSGHWLGFDVCPVAPAVSLERDHARWWLSCNQTGHPILTWNGVNYIQDIEFD